MATNTNPARTVELANQVDSLRRAIARYEAKAAPIQEKLDAGKIKADGPKAKELASLRDSIRLWKIEIDRCEAELDLLEIEVADLTPEQIDTLLFPLWAKRWQLGEWIHSTRDHICQSLWPEAWEHAHRFDRRAHRAFRDRYGLNQANERLVRYEVERDEVDAEAAVYEDEFKARGGWVRYVLVQGGHLHYDHCHTLRFDTARFLIPQASGLTPDEVVGRFGTTACTKCFPEAPV